MEPTPQRPDQLLLHDPKYTVLICRECRYAIQPTGIARHLKEIHKIHRSRRRPYMDYVSRFQLADPQDVLKAQVAEFPVQYLPVLDGLRCRGADGCHHLCVSTKRMQKHWLDAHGRRGESANGDWQATPLQTFFRGNLLRYFTHPNGQPVCVGYTRRQREREKLTNNSSRLQLRPAQGTH